MRQAVMGFMLVVVFLFSLLGLHTIQVKITRQQELDAQLGTALEQCMLRMRVETMEAMTKEEMVADVCQSMMLSKTSGSNLAVEIYQVDEVLGILDVKVSMQIPQIYGVGTVESRKCMVYDAWDEKETEVYQIRFQEGDALWKELSWTANTTLDASCMDNLPEGERWQLMQPYQGTVYTAETICQLRASTDLVFQRWKEEVDAT
jgi:hypothetical protein